MNKKNKYIPPSILITDFSIPKDEFNEHYKGVAYGTLGHNYSKTIYPDGTITEWKDGKKIRCTMSKLKQFWYRIKLNILLWLDYYFGGK